MKLAALGVVAIVAGIVSGTDGLAVAGAIWVAGGLLLKALLTGVERTAVAGGTDPSWNDLLGGRRGFAAAAAVLTGGASVAVGLVPIGFESDDWLRWIPVVLGSFIAGVQLLAIVMFALGSGLGAAIDAFGDPDHPATITVHSFAETGVRINDRPRLEFELTVRPEGRDAYDVSAKMVVGFADLGSLQRGRTYRGLVDVEKPNAVSIDWHDIVDDGAATTVVGSDDDVRQRLARVDELLSDGVITPDEHAGARRDIIGDL